MGLLEKSQKRKVLSVVFAKWAVRFCFAAVFVINCMCALQFIFWPEAFCAAYELQGVAGCVALQGMGIAFLMWNATYPAVIIAPLRFRSLAFVVIGQQVIGLVGESWILFSLPVGHEVLFSSILRFIVFDAAGLVIMAVSLFCLYCTFPEDSKLANALSIASTNTSVFS